MPDFDLVVIGSGPAGEKGAAQAAYFGKRVALVEREPVLGGATANTGTLPSKTLRETAVTLAGLRQRALYGLEAGLRPAIGIRDLMRPEERVKTAERQRVRENLARHSVEVVHGSARFLDAGTVEVTAPGTEPRRLTAGCFLVATGSSPYRPPFWPFADPRIHDSDEILTIEEIPPSLAVIGGGVIGSEYACIFAALGVKVTLLEARDRILSFLDAELSAQLSLRMRELGVELLLSSSVEGLELGDPGLRLSLAGGGSLEAASVLIASGRTGNTSGLGLQALGVEVGPRGHVVVDASYRTAVPRIYAAGDVIGSPALSSTSMEQARVAMVHAFELRYKLALPSVLPYAIYTIPELSSAGETEEALVAAGVDYVAGCATFAGNARGTIIGAVGLLKLLFRREDMKLLGVHALGEQASELVHLGVAALLTGATADLFVQMCFNYPTLSEGYKYATYDALGRRERAAQELPAARGVG